jgi:hypothetical protein
VKAAQNPRRRVENRASQVTLCAVTIEAITPDERAQWKKIADPKKILKPDGDDDFGRRTAGDFGPPLPQELQTCRILLVERVVTACAGAWGFGG